MATIDTFTRADSTTSLGTTSDGTKVWSALNGTWGISSNQAYIVSTGTIDGVAGVDTGQSDGTIAVTCRTTVGKQGIAFRIQDASNYWRTVFFGGNLYLQKYTGGTGADVTGSPIVCAVADGDVLSVELSGTSIVVKLNGVTKYSITDSTYQSATMHGLAHSVFGDPAYKYDDFSFTPAAGLLVADLAHSPQWQALVAQ